MPISTSPLLRSTYTLLTTTRVLISKAAALAIIAAMMVPMWLAKPIMTVKAAAIAGAPQSGSQPSPYIVPAAETGTSASVRLATALLGLFSSRVEPETYTRPAMFTHDDPAEMAKYRLDPINATGGTNLYSQNFFWGTNLVHLPGRGLDLDIPISYNSLVWLQDKDSSEIVFDPDSSNVSPGFRMGFPVIEAPYYDTDKGVYVFLMVGTDGSRKEFRDSGSFYYDSADSSYGQLFTDDWDEKTAYEDIHMTLTLADGTKMNYAWYGGKFQPNEIKDRNGNYITITYNGSGGVDTVTDTLGRVVSVNYDSGGYPTSITQSWKGTNGSGTSSTHTWASFHYSDSSVSTSFGSTLTKIGPNNLASVKALDKVTYADGSHTDFAYNDYIQVRRVRNYAPDDQLLSYTTTNLDSVSGTQGDCPRFTATREWVENFNLDSYGVAQEVVTTNTKTTSSSYSLPGSISGSGTRVEVANTSHPDGLYTRVYYSASGYKEGMPVATEDCTGTNCATRLRWTWTDYTQDNTGLGYILNPRVTETRVGDGTNTKRTTIAYGSYSLPSSVKVYDTDLSTVLKTQTFSYVNGTQYINRHLLVFPLEQDLYSGTESGTLMSRVSYGYDESGYTGTGQSVSPTQHDNSNYGTSFNYRGNVTSTTRWNATAPSNSSYAVSSSVKYNTAGMPISTTDPRGRVTGISYTDNWSDSTIRTTYAYPTSITDPNSHSISMKYRFDFGAAVESVGLVPAGQTYGKTSKRTFDDTTGRVTQDSIYVNTTLKSYQRYEYPTNGIEAKSYATIVDTDSDGPDTDDEVLTDTWFDGAGRTRATRTEHPGSTGGWSAVLTDYDVLGRTYRQSVPTEVSISSPYDPAHWSAAGDDSTRGFVYNYSYYDWKGRPTRTVPSDSTGSDGKDTLISYAGCGCAGGQVTTISGPVTTAVDVSGTTQTTKRRTQKSYEDILGRTFKTEIWDLDGGGSAPYSTTKTTFNALDLPTLVRQYAGSDSSSTYQDTTMSYDGHGRLYQKHIPQQSSSTYTTYSYNGDDSISSVTDARGAVTSYVYGHVDDSGSSEYRGMLTKVQYSVPGGSGITDPSDVSFAYDAVGDRTQMVDGLGQVDYSYDSLSRMTSELRDFTDTLSNAPISGSKYELDYTYTLSGGLASITDPFGAVINYASDKTGRTTAVGGSGFHSISSYASGVTYRAFGAVKGLSYDTAYSTSISLSYDNALRPAAYQATSSANTSDIQNKTYSYYNDGSVSQAVNALDSNYSQSYDYDFTSRLKRDEFGTGSVGTGKPYKEILGYDAFSNITSRSTWPASSTAVAYTASFTNNRKSSGGFNSASATYNADGDVVAAYASSNSLKTWSFDAAGRMEAWAETEMCISAACDQGETLTFDGDGRGGKRHKRSRNRANGNTAWFEENSYSIYSSVTGQEISTLNDSGAKVRTSVYLNGTIIAEQSVPDGEALFKHADPVTGSTMQAQESGEITPNNVGRTEVEALGANVPTVADDLSILHDYTDNGSVRNPESGCQINGAPIECTDQLRLAGAVGFNTIGGAIWAEHTIRGHWLHDSESQVTINRQNNDFWEFENGKVRFLSDPPVTFTWLEAVRADIGRSASRRTKEKLGDCVSALFDDYFPQYIVNGQGVDISRDARFVPDFNGIIPKAVKKIKPDAWAVTLGLYEIHYDTGNINLSSPSWDALGVLAEELAHGEQFVKAWQAMPDIAEPVVNPKDPRKLMNKYRRPTDAEAFGRYAADYVTASAIAIANRQDPYYGNQYEIEAQQKRAVIMEDLRRKYPSEWRSRTPICR